MMPERCLKCGSDPVVTQTEAMQRYACGSIYSSNGFIRHTVPMGWTYSNTCHTTCGLVTAKVTNQVERG